MLISRLWSRIAAAAAVAVFALLIDRLRSDLSTPSQCDTTYLYEGYERVHLPPALSGRHLRYRLFRFIDGDPQLAQGKRPTHAIQTLPQPSCDPTPPPRLRCPPPPPPAAASPAAAVERRHTVPVLFVHGHLGSYQQMRSLASETGRELRRQLAQGRLVEPGLWLDWVAPDFNAQPSALEGALLVRRPEGRWRRGTSVWRAAGLAGWLAGWLASTRLRALGGVVGRRAMGAPRPPASSAPAMAGAGWGVAWVARAPAACVRGDSPTDCPPRLANTPCVSARGATNGHQWTAPAPWQPPPAGAAGRVCGRLHP